MDGKPGELEDGEIVRRILSGEEDLFEVLVRRYQARVVSHVSRMVGVREDAIDLSQEIFLKVFQALDRFNPSYKFSTWLFRIAGNAAIDHLRKRRPRTVPLEAPDPEGGAGPFPVEQRSPGLDPYGRLRNVERGRPSCGRSRSCRRTSASSSRSGTSRVCPMRRLRPSRTCRSARSRTNSFAPEPY